MKDKLISREQIQEWVPVLNTRLGGFVVKCGMALLGLDKVNAIYDRCKKYEGVEFCEHVLNDMGVTIVAENTQVFERFNGLPFITVSNHPYDHADALGIISIVGRYCPDYKVTANFILSLIDTMSANFIRVNPYEKNVAAAGAVSVRNCLNHIEEGKPLGFFPAGAVSYPILTERGFVVKDGPWKSSTVKLIQKAAVPVIPIWVSGKNSWIYNLLGLFGWQARTIRIPHELSNKRGKRVKIRFGEPLMPEQLSPISNSRELAEFLKARVYDLAE